MREAHNSKLKIQNSKLKMREAHNSKLKTQNSKLKMREAHNSKLKTQNSKLINGQSRIQRGLGRPCLTL